MGCVTPSVQGVADKTLDAKAQVEKLQAMLNADAAKYKADFFKEIDSSLKDANISDAIQKGYNMDIKTEYSSEFSLDKIAMVIKSALKTLAAVTDPTSPNPATSEAAIASYADLVNSVAEAAKSKSNSSSSMSFAMNRLSPGTYAFLCAVSVSIKDEKLFGTEGITSTALLYRFMQSIDDIKNDASFDEVQIDKKNFLKMKELQASLTDRLADGKIDIDEWGKLDDKYSGMVNRIAARLKANGYDTSKINKAAHIVRSPGYIAAPGNAQIVNIAIEKLSGMGEQYKNVIEKSKARLLSNYF